MAKKNALASNKANWGIEGALAAVKSIEDCFFTDDLWHDANVSCTRSCLCIFFMCA
jgi:hypothetical protein